jgi:predicted acyltransferase
VILGVGHSGDPLSCTGNYKILHIAGFALLTIGLGWFTILDSSIAAWTLAQFFVVFGSGLMMPVLLPAVPAGLEEKDTATPTALWAFTASALSKACRSLFPSSIISLIDTRLLSVHCRSTC